MNILEYSGLVKKAVAFSTFVFSFATAHAECNNTKDWSKYPGKEVRVLIGFLQNQQPGFGESYLSSSSSDYPYPNLLDDGDFIRHGNGRLSDDETSYISYYEHDGKNKWRLCRLESWWPPGAGSDSARERMLAISKLYLSKNPDLAKAIAGHLALHAVLYFYDEKGRIAKIAEGDFMKPESPALIKICRKYDERDRLLIFVNPHTTQTCSNANPDLKDDWLRYRYGEYRGKQVTLLDEWHHGSPDGRWRKKFEEFRTSADPASVRGAARAKSGRGVTTIFGSNVGKLDDNAANTVVDSFGHWTGATYYFTKPPVPLEVLEHPEQIYRYERRRQTYIDGIHFKLLELFKPNEHISRHRYYYVGDMLRNEQLNEKGRVTRVITMDDYRQPRPGPHPDVDDKLLTDKGLRIYAHQIYHRVYDLDAKGRVTLVAVSWNRKFRLNPLKKTHRDFAELFYGTPDGKVKWKNLEEFEKAFGFTSNAAEVFPDRRANPVDNEDDD